MPHKFWPLLEPAAADAFLAGYKRVLLRVAGGTRETGSNLLATLVRARCRMVEDAAVLGQALDGETTPPVDPAVFRAISTLSIDDYVYLKDTKDYSIFIQASGKSAFGVVGLTERIRDIVGASDVMIETALVRYRGKFGCDGLVRSSLFAISRCNSFATRPAIRRYSPTQPVITLNGNRHLRWAPPSHPCAGSRSDTATKSLHSMSGTPMAPHAKPRRLSVRSTKPRSLSAS